MKTLKRFIPLLLIALLTSSHTCAKRIKGSGNVITRNIALDSFTHVNVNAPLSATIEKGSEFTVSIIGDDNLVELFEVKQSGSTLVIKCVDKHYDFKEIKAHITTPVNVDEVKLSGLGKIELRAPVNPSRFSASMSGMGKLHLHDIATDKMEASMGGMGKLIATGQVRDLSVSIGGMGSVDCENLKAANVDCNNSGMGSLSVYASESINARLSGMGSLTYYGNPAKVDKKVSGMGRISAK